MCPFGSPPSLKESGSSDVSVGTDLHDCAQRRVKRCQNMPDRCIAASCSKVADPSKGIFLHTIPFFGDSRPGAIKRRKKWVDFVKA